MEKKVKKFSVDPEKVDEEINKKLLEMNLEKMKTSKYTVESISQTYLPDRKKVEITIVFWR